jgi:hypothetical protein
MKAARSTLVHCVLIMGAIAASAQQQTVLIKAHLEPAEVVNGETAQLTVEMQAAQTANNLRMEITAPPGFRITQGGSVKVPAFQGNYTLTPFLVERADAQATVGAHTLLVRVFTGEGTANIATVDTSIPFSYVSRISIPAYFLLGGLGILIGYALRVLIKVLQTVPAPAPAPQQQQGAAVGPVTAFVQNHYYLVDCGVTLTIGLLSLALLLKNNHVPDSGLYWYSALGAGVALGLLTNSELLSKLR